MHPLAAALLATTFLAGCASSEKSIPPTAAQQEPRGSTMQLGTFSVSLTVKDIAASREFYEKLGFSIVAGNQDQNWLVLQNSNATIGIFQGMFDKNILTFNPGWDKNKDTLENFQDVRELQRTLKDLGIEPTTEADESTTGPAHCVITDPDGNPILLDQHVDSPSAS